jgi:hypothetical protein
MRTRIWIGLHLDWVTVIARSEATTQSILPLLRDGLLRFARNDGLELFWLFEIRIRCNALACVS